jgi:hypothetical protein
MSVVQLLLFEEAPAPKVITSVPKTSGPPVLNGFYYEQSSRKFVSFVLGRRHYEMLASRCRHPKEWQDKIKKERVI